MTKVCSKCKDEKDVSKFYKDKKYKDGLRSWCKKCDSKSTTEYYKRIKNNPNRKIIYLDLKICPKCKEEKDVSEFYKDKYTKDRLHFCCKECAKKNSKESFKRIKNNPNREIIYLDSKICSKCKKEKDANEFSKSKGYKDDNDFYKYYSVLNLSGDLHIDRSIHPSFLNKLS